MHAVSLGNENIGTTFTFETFSNFLLNYDFYVWKIKLLSYGEELCAESIKWMFASKFKY